MTPDKSHRDQISLIIQHVNEKFDIKELLVKKSEIKGKLAVNLQKKFYQC